MCERKHANLIYKEMSGNTKDQWMDPLEQIIVITSLIGILAVSTAILYCYEKCRKQLAKRNNRYEHLIDHTYSGNQILEQQQDEFHTNNSESDHDSHDN